MNLSRREGTSCSLILFNYSLQRLSTRLTRFLHRLRNSSILIFPPAIFYAAYVISSTVTGRFIVSFITCSWSDIAADISLFSVTVINLLEWPRVITSAACRTSDSFQLDRRFDRNRVDCYSV